MEGEWDIKGTIKVSRHRRGNAGGGSGTYEARVVASGDDGWSSPPSTYDPTSGIQYIGEIVSSVRQSWARFLSVDIPQGATIDVAYIDYVSRVTQTKSTKSNIYAEDVDDAVAPTSLADHDGKTRTTNFTAWDDEPQTAEDVERSPSIVDVIQEIVDRGSWASGNALQILHDDDGSAASNWYDFYPYDSDTAKAVLLHVEWSS